VSIDETKSRSLITNLSNAPGVYRMLDDSGKALYVGKARNLRKRVSSYFRSNGLSTRIQLLMQKTVDIDITVTHTEGEALLLENNLIKSELPRFNILLRDDKSYPYVYLSSEHEFPRLSFYRGARHGKGRYFGPYPSTSAVRDSLNMLQKVFPVRQCEDSYFRNRSRPCLQYQIKRCSAPCVGLVNARQYQEDVRHAVMFLQGKSNELIDRMAEKMDQAAEQLDYETATLFRDRIARLKRVQEKQYISGEHGDADIVAVVVNNGMACVYVSFVRGGCNLGGKSFFPRVSDGDTDTDVMAAFLPQYYLGKTIPRNIYLNSDIADREVLQQTFCDQSEYNISLASQCRGARQHWLRMAEMNAEDALRRRLASKASLQQRFEVLQEELRLEAIPERIECFDISHTAGEATVASCVVFDVHGPVKSDYRRFNIRGITAGEDYAAMQQAVTRRYKRVIEGEGRLPDLVLIDGGKGQLHAAEEAMHELQIKGLVLLAVAKGKERKPGKEQLFLSGNAAATILAADSPALHLIQQVRDEAHRFAITGHRQRRNKQRVTSVLEQIAGIGGKRRQALLKNFGGIQELALAGVEDIACVSGISRELAQKIYNVFHEQE
jgi:excinuclease ABC subunit C